LGKKKKQGESKWGESVIWLFLKIDLSTTLSMKWSLQELSIDVIVIHRGNLKNNQMKLLPCFTLIPKTGLNFYCVYNENLKSCHFLIERIDSKKNDGNTTKLS